MPPSGAAKRGESRIARSALVGAVAAQQSHSEPALNTYTNILNEIGRGGPHFESNGRRLSPLYFPQYDALLCPVPYLEDGDNQPSLGSSDESKIRYLATFAHELAHRQINYRTSVGLAHLSFTFRKICALFHWFPKFGDINATVKSLLSIDAQARAFFNASHLWDETYALNLTVVLAKHLFRLPTVAEQYTKQALRAYPEIRKPYELLSKIIERFASSPEEGGLLLASIFDAAAAIDAYELMEADSNEAPVALDLNVDARFVKMLEFCGTELDLSRDLQVGVLAGRLIDYLADVGISRGSQYDPERCVQEFMEICHRNIDGLLFTAMYTTMVRQLARDMPELLKGFSEPGLPLSTVTIRPGDEPNSFLTVGRQTLVITREKLDFELMTMDVNVGMCCEDAFMFGLLTDCIVWELRTNRTAAAPDFVLRPEFTTALETARRALKGEIAANELERTKTSLVRCMEGINYRRFAGGKESGETP
jgi:hypothetical protein